MAKINRRASDPRQAEKAQKANKPKSPFIKYCMTVTACLLIASMGFIFIVYSGDDSTIQKQSWTVRGIATYVTANTTTSTIDKPSDGDSALADQGSGNPFLPGIPYIPSSDWYSQVPAAISSAGSIVDYLDFGGVQIGLYNSLPWDATQDTYVFNVTNAAQDVISYINTYGNSGLSVVPAFARELQGETAYTVIDGVAAIEIAVVPSLVDRTYCADFATDSWQYRSTPARQLYGYVKDGTPRKYCIILEKSGNTYYLPVVANDAKGHTFPGGVCQTHVQVTAYDPNTGQYTVNVGDTGVRGAKWTMADYIANLDTVVNASTSENSKLRAYFQVNVEFYRVPANYKTTSGIGNYNIIGMVAW